MFHTNADINPYANSLLLDNDIHQAQKERHLYGGLQIHGKYCGPTWTANKAKVAKDVPLEEYRSVLPNDPLDGACRQHDWDCGHTGVKGECSRADDTKLINKAMKISRDKSQPLAFRAKAYAIAKAMEVARTTRGSGMEGSGMKGGNLEFLNFLREILPFYYPQAGINADTPPYDVMAYYYQLSLRDRLEINRQREEGQIPTVTDQGRTIPLEPPPLPPSGDTLVAPDRIPPQDISYLAPPPDPPSGVETLVAPDRGRTRRTHLAPSDPNFGNRKTNLKIAKLNEQIFNIGRQIRDLDQQLEFLRPQVLTYNPYIPFPEMVRIQTHYNALIQQKTDLEALREEKKYKLNRLMGAGSFNSKKRVYR